MLMEFNLTGERNMTIMKALNLMATESIGMITDGISGTRNLTKAYAEGTEILLSHAQYYNTLHAVHDAEKQTELHSKIAGISPEAQAMLAAIVSKG